MYRGVQDIAVRHSPTSELVHIRAGPRQSRSTSELVHVRAGPHQSRSMSELVPMASPSLDKASRLIELHNFSTLGRTTCIFYSGFATRKGQQPQLTLIILGRRIVGKVPVSRSLPDLSSGPVLHQHGRPRTWGRSTSTAQPISTLQMWWS